LSQIDTGSIVFICLFVLKLFYNAAAPIVNNAPLISTII